MNSIIEELNTISSKILEYDKVINDKNIELSNKNEELTSKEKELEEKEKSYDSIEDKNSEEAFKKKLDVVEVEIQIKSLKASIEVLKKEIKEDRINRAKEMDNIYKKSLEFRNTFINDDSKILNLYDSEYKKMSQINLEINRYEELRKSINDILLVRKLDTLLKELNKKRDKINKNVTGLNLVINNLDIKKQTKTSTSIELYEQMLSQRINSINGNIRELQYSDKEKDIETRLSLKNQRDKLQAELDNLKNATGAQAFNYFQDERVLENDEKIKANNNDKKKINDKINELQNEKNNATSRKLRREFDKEIRKLQKKDAKLDKTNAKIRGKQRSLMMPVIKQRAKENKKEAKLMAKEELSTRKANDYAKLRASAQTRGGMLSKLTAKKYDKKYNKYKKDSDNFARQLDALRKSKSTKIEGSRKMNMKTSDIKSLPRKANENTLSI